MGRLIGRGRDGYSALHAIGGTGEGGWPIIGEKNRSVNEADRRRTAQNIGIHKLRWKERRTSRRQPD
ncbi:MAG: hypothetical protein K2X93_06595 [Candidatus Obscuribacterales bacterium]|nr:hypothetical protein [Candidatus Obscuribacterales bacterium]